jgi:hypothetical protein
VKLSYDVVDEARKVLKAHGIDVDGIDCPEVAADWLLSLIANQDGIIEIRRHFEQIKQEQNSELRQRVSELMGENAAAPWNGDAPRHETDAIKKAQTALAELAQVTNGHSRQLHNADQQIAHLRTCNHNLVERLRHLERGEGLA